MGVSFSDGCRYYTWGAGKLFHPGKPAQNDQTYSWSTPYVTAGGGACRTFAGGHPSNYACLSDDDVADDQVADATVEQLESLVARNWTAAHGKPFFVGGGIHKPHLPYFYKPSFAQQYPPEADTAIPPTASLAIPKNMPPIAWMACMGLQGMRFSAVATRGHALVYGGVQNTSAEYGSLLSVCVSVCL